MPIYEYRCDTCRREEDMFNRVAQRRTGAPRCCDNPMTLLISAVRVNTDIEPYKSKYDGTVITSRREHREHLARHSLQEVGSEMPPWMKEKKYIESHGGTWTPPKKEDAPHTKFEWQDADV